ncbi:MAG: HAMP domain-containing sensor histidine kinase [Campylobacterales bacterium]|nr:HAMP domain-containing sensor histidine kinase [Campylobacterales bacterium]
MKSILVKNIKVKVTLLLIFGITIIFSLFFTYRYNTVKEHEQERLEAYANRVTKRLTQNLVAPLWELDEKWISTVLYIEMENKELGAVYVIGKGNINISKERAKNMKDERLERYTTIMHDDEVIGTVSIYITKKYLDEYLFDQKIAYLGSGIILILFLILALYLILDYFVLNPINSIFKSVKAIAKGDFTQKAEIIHDDEIGELAQGFNNMVQSVHEKEEMMLAQSRHAAMGEMISMIAHQWRQPIAAIAMGANNMLIDIELDALEPKNVKEGAELMLDQAMHLSKTIDDFKNFFRPNKQRETVLVNDVLEETFTIIEKSLENHNIAIKRSYGSKTPISLFSRELLQVFINIIKNAKEALLSANIENPIISVITREDEEQVYISICDNGKGIDKAIVAKIYEPYFSTKDEKTGTGLGLYMSKIIVEKHLLGTLHAENIEEGGVCFVISLPKKGKNDE